MPRTLEWVPMPLLCLDMEAEAPRSEKLPQAHTQLRSRCLPVHGALTMGSIPQRLGLSLSPTLLAPLWPSVHHTDRPCNWEQAPTPPVPQFPLLQNEEAGPDKGFPSLLW